LWVSLPPFVILPVGKGSIDIALLALLGPAAKQNHHAFPVFSEIHAVSGAEIDPALEHAGTDSFDVREIAASQSRQGVATLAAA
jgi:hypothetical protein